MKKSATLPKTVLETILDWSQNRPIWQRDALRRIVSKGKLDNSDLQELVELCKLGRGAAGKRLKPTPLTKSHLPANPGQGPAVSLISIADADGVNNLASDQTLPFDPSGITIIYGDNAAGKSGYARILKRTCRARRSVKIEPNVYGQSPLAKPSATISYSVGGITQPPEKWVDEDHPHPIMSAVSVFDSECASVYINDKNDVAFRPFGLDIPDELAGACQSLKEALTSEKKQFEKARNPLFRQPPWKATTVVGKTLAGLKQDTDVQKIRELGTLTKDEAGRLSRLREDLSKNPDKAAAEQTLKADNIKRLLGAVNLIETRTADSALAAVFGANCDARVKREAARLAAGKAFSREPLAGIGGEVWRSLWESARRYSTEVAYPGKPFPPPLALSAYCVLCQQPLPADALDRMARFEEFIQKDTERRAQAAEETAQKAVDRLASVSICTRSLKANLQEVAIHDPVLEQQTRRFVGAARLRRYVLMKNLGSAEDPAIPAVPKNPGNSLATFEDSIRKYASELQKSASGKERKNLEADLAELSDREILGGIIQTIEDEVSRLKSIHFLAQCLADTPTNAITRLGNKIADTVITPKLRDRFQKEIVKLAGEKVRVEFVRSGGQYGSPQYQVQLFAKPGAKVRDILSEGERTCVALASFLTEVATATHRSAFVFDDPVSSLDHRWRKKVAQRLVEEAEHRQIVVFTHDLVFVNDLSDLASSKQRTSQLFTVSRGPAGVGVVEHGLPWRGQSVEDRIDKLEKATREAKKLYDNDDEEAYRDEAANIYIKLRVSWERALEHVAFFRVVERHRDYVNTKNLKKVSVLSEPDCDDFHVGFKKCCDVSSAHDPSSGRNAEAPPPDEILQDIQALKDWVKAIRGKQKQIK